MITTRAILFGSCFLLRKLPRMRKLQTFNAFRVISVSSFNWNPGKRMISSCCCTKCTHEVRACWRCDADITTLRRSEFFCPSCNVIQPLEDHQTYFDIMDCPAEFKVDVSKLAKRYRELQSQLHPDKFVSKSEEEKQLSSFHSTIVNKAYFTLLKPLRRGIYLLKLEGLSIEEGEAVHNPEFLMEILEVNEELDEAATADKISRIEEKNKEKLRSCTKDAADAFSRDCDTSVSASGFQLGRVTWESPSVGVNIRSDIGAYPRFL